MKFHTVLALIAAIVVAIMVFAPETEARIPRRKLQALKKIGLVALLLKGKKKILFPLPLPLPLPLPVIKHLQPVPEVHAEPIHEPYVMPEQSYSHQSYGGGDLGGYGDMY